MSVQIDTQPFTYGGTCWVIVRQAAEDRGIPTRPMDYLRLPEAHFIDGAGKRVALPSSEIPFHTQAEAMAYLRFFVYAQEVSVEKMDADYWFEQTQIDPELDGAWFVAINHETSQFEVFNQATGTGYPEGTFAPFSLSHFVAGPYSNYGDALDMAGAMDQNRGEWDMQRMINERAASTPPGALYTWTTAEHHPTLAELVTEAQATRRAWRLGRIVWTPKPTCPECHGVWTTLPGSPDRCAWCGWHPGLSVRTEKPLWWLALQLAAVRFALWAIEPRHTHAEWMALGSPNDDEDWDDEIPF